MPVDLLFATIDNGCYAEYLGQCGLDVMVLKPGDPPATTYNRILDAAKERYVCFIHADVTCRGLPEAIEQTIAERPGYCLGAVGVNNGYLWSRTARLFDLITVDSCCLVVDKAARLRFDDKTFDGFHLYVEDYCMRAGRVSTIYIDAFDGLLAPPKTVGNSFLIHHSFTYRKLGPMWGDYIKYRALLETKYPGAQTT